MTTNEIQCYEQACFYMEDVIQSELIKRNISFKKDYNTSYAVYFNFSKYNQPYFRLANKQFKNTSIEIDINLYDTDKMFRAVLWKYDNNHHWLQKDFATLEECKEFILNNLDFFGIVQHGFEQLSLFDC